MWYALLAMPPSIVHPDHIGGRVSLTRMGFPIREKNRLPTQLVFLTLQISLTVRIIPWYTLTITPWDTIISDEVVLLVIRPPCDTSLISTVGVVPSFSMAFATRRSSRCCLFLVNCLNY